MRPRDAPVPEPPVTPSLPWRAGSASIMLLTGMIARGFLYGANYVETHGLDQFLRLLEERRDVGRRRRGLLTVSNHWQNLSRKNRHGDILMEMDNSIDDPLIWGVLPFSYCQPDNLRWSLGSHDLCHQNFFTANFFTLGQTLPTHRLAHSPHGGLFQPTMTQTIRLLSRGPFLRSVDQSESVSLEPVEHHELADPFSAGSLTYSTNGQDSFPAPSAYLNRRHSWVHIFPEGKIHQASDYWVRYFKWGVARLILESDPCPDVVPMWIEGPDQIMHESRTFPRFVPRVGRRVSVTFGERVDAEAAFGDLRERWRELRRREARRNPGRHLEVGVLTDELKYGQEAVELRKECTMRMRNEVLKLRRERGWPDEDPKWGFAETVQEEGGKREGQMEDGSWVKDT